jgi:hypothetical protein
MRRLGRALAALALALGAASLPQTVAVACSCGFAGYDDTVAAADVAFIGTVVGENEPPPGGMMAARYAFEVELSKAPMPSPYEMDATFGGDANCGFDMGIGEEWLVIASEWEGRLETNLCNGTTLTADLDRGELGRVKGMLTPNDPTAVPEQPGFILDVPAPILGMLGAVAVVGALSVLAFRRDRIR